MTPPQNLVDRLTEFFPCRLLPLQHGASLRRQSIKAAATFTGFFHPLAVDEPAIFEAAEHGIQRADPEGEPSVRARLDELADLVSVSRSRVEEREDDELGAAFLEFVVWHDAVNYNA